MHYLQSAPKTPPQGVAKGQTRPPHYYNYAKHNNPTANSMQYPNVRAQTAGHNPGHNPYATNARALPEDKTIEELDENRHTSSLFTILLIALTTIIIIVGGGIGGYFLFRHKPNSRTPANPKAKGKSRSRAQEQALDGERVSRETSSDSYESDESGEQPQIPLPHVAEQQKQPGANYVNNNMILIQQMYFNNVHDPNEYIAFTPRNPFPFKSLLELESLKTLFERDGWRKERGTTYNQIPNSLCEYFRHNLRDFAGYTDVSNYEPLCQDQYRLIKHPNGGPLRFDIISEQEKTPYENAFHSYQSYQHGVQLELQLLIFKYNTEIHYLTGQQLQQWSMSSPPQQYQYYWRRRLIASGLPSEQIILQHKGTWGNLPENYNINGKHYHDWDVAYSHHIHIAHAQPEMRGGPPYQSSHRLDAQLHLAADAYGPEKIYEQEASCQFTAEKLSQLWFESFTFTLTVTPNDESSTSYSCKYQSPYSSEPHHQSAPYWSTQRRRRMMNGRGRAESVGSVEQPELAGISAIEPEDSNTGPLQSLFDGDEVERRDTAAHARLQEQLAQDALAAGAASGKPPQPHLSVRTAAAERPIPDTEDNQPEPQPPVMLAQEQNTATDAWTQAHDSRERQGLAANAASPPLQQAQRTYNPIDPQPIEQPAGYTAAAAWSQPYASHGNGDIKLNKNWWGNILRNEHTKCSPINPSQTAQFQKPCDIISDYSHQPLGPRGPDDDCHCYIGCDIEWKVIEEGSKLEDVQCDKIDIYATDFEGVLRYPPQFQNRRPEVELSFGGTYTVHAERIYTKRVPYWRCTLDPEEGAAAEAMHYTPLQPQPHALPHDAWPRDNTLRHAHRDAGVRRLVSDEDTSSAWSKDNMFMIIGSTIFFILIGIQSFYWISHAI